MMVYFIKVRHFRHLGKTMPPLTRLKRKNEQKLFYSKLNKWTLDNDSNNI